MSLKNAATIEVIFSISQFNHQMLFCVQKGWFHTLATRKHNVPFVILEEVHGLPFVYYCPSDFVSIHNEVGDTILELQRLYGLRKLR